VIELFEATPLSANFLAAATYSKTVWD